jgi:hypothetical protein
LEARIDQGLNERAESLLGVGRNLTPGSGVRSSRKQIERVNRGFAACGEGDVLSRINADDRHQTTAFVAVAQVLHRFHNVRWVTGSTSAIAEAGFDKGYMGRRLYPRKAIQAGLYDEWSSPSFSTKEPWRQEVWREAGGLRGHLRAGFPPTRSWSPSLACSAAGSVRLVFAALTKELSEDVKTVQIGAMAALAKVRGDIVGLYLYLDDVVGLAPMRDALRYVLKPFFVGRHQFMVHDSSEGLIIALADLWEVRIIHEVSSST